MCGIVGITWNDPELVERMASTLTHRGPDQAGVYADEHVSLGHRRLSIIDLSEDGRQPMSNEDGSVWVVFNGEIYNFQELREILQDKGHIFRSRCDTEVIVHAWEEYGPECLERLRGMFALAVWDSRRRELFVARDRIGIKPLYYCSFNGDLIFASEIKAILQAPQVSRRVSPQAIYHYVGYEFVPAPETMFEDIRKLPPGHCLRFRDGRLESKQYWDLDLTPAHRTRAGHEAALRDSMRDAVGSHLVSDVPLGVFLSGGLDSSALVAFMHGCGVEPIQTFSLGYADQSFSELEYARIVSKTFGTQHRELIIEPVTPEVIEKAVWHLDEPMTDLSTVPLYLLCRKVREYVTVCLSGEGGDEAMVGYDRFKASKANRYYSLLPGWIRRGVIGPMVGCLPDRPQKKGLVNLLKRFIEGGLLPEDGGHMRWQYFSNPRLEEQLYAKDFRRQIEADPFAPLRASAARCGSKDALDREIYVDTRFTMPDSVLMKVDKMSMAHSLEVRVPLLDHAFIETCASIPGPLKLRGFTTKAIFRTAMKGILPDVILRRGKQGYSLPVKNWLRRELHDYLLENLSGSPIIRDTFDGRQLNLLIQEHQEYRANHSHVLWALLNMAIWHRLFVEQGRDGHVLERNGVSYAGSRNNGRDHLRGGHCVRRRDPLGDQ